MSYNEIIESLCDILKQRYEIEYTSELFNTLTSKEKVSFTYHLLVDDNLLPIPEGNSSKCTSQAIESRSRGNKAFICKKDEEALILYSKSIRSSLPNTQELSLAYANRSAVLFKLRKYDLCLLDIDRALTGNYPDELKCKLLERKNKCLEVTARSQVVESQEFVNDLSNVNLFEKLGGDAEDSPSQLNQWDATTNRQTKHEIRSVKTFPLPEIPVKNSLISNASEKIRIDFSPEMGRHLVATKDIEPGEILAVEKPYASILLSEYYTTHCTNCFVRNPAMIPCDKCSLVMFCNEKCRAASMERYHATECDILSFLHSLDVSKMELLAVRTLMIATNQGKSLCTLYDDPIFGNPLPHPLPSGLFDIKNVYVSNNYSSVHMLEENFFRRPPSDLFQRSATAAILLHAVKYSSFFQNAHSDTVSDSPRDLEEFAGSLLLKYLCIILCNAHEISEVIQDGSKPESKITEGNLEIGAALYPLLSLINHSCDPNVVRHSHHDFVVLRTIQPIPKDQQIFDNYGYHYAVHDVQKRQNQLKLQYFFTCNCNACKFDWPLYKELPSKNPKYSTASVDPKKLEEYSENFNNTLCKIMKGDMTGVVESLRKHLSLLHVSIKRPWKEYSACQEALKQCFALLGNRYITSEDIVFR